MTVERLFDVCVSFCMLAFLHETGPSEFICTCGQWQFVLMSDLDEKGIEEPIQRERREVSVPVCGAMTK